MRMSGTVLRDPHGSLGGRWGRSLVRQQLVWVHEVVLPPLELCVHLWDFLSLLPPLLWGWEALSDQGHGRFTWTMASFSSGSPVLALPSSWLLWPKYASSACLSPLPLAHGLLGASGP